MHEASKFRKLLIIDIGAGGGGEIKDKNLIVSPVQVEPHTGGQQLILLILKEQIGGWRRRRMVSSVILTRSTICCRVTPNVITMGEDSFMTGLFWVL